MGAALNACYRDARGRSIAIYIRTSRCTTAELTAQGETVTKQGETCQHGRFIGGCDKYPCVVKQGETGGRCTTCGGPFMGDHRQCEGQRKPEPRIVAECWTCKGMNIGYRVSGQRLSECRAAGHNVRPVREGRD